jgi:hypothetical protein
LHHLRDLVAWGLERRGGPVGLDVDLFARSVQTLAEGAAQLVLADPERYPVERFTGFARSALSALQPGAPDACGAAERTTTPRSATVVAPAGA